MLSCSIFRLSRSSGRYSSSASFLWWPRRWPHALLTSLHGMVSLIDGVSSKRTHPFVAHLDQCAFRAACAGRTALAFGLIVDDVSSAVQLKVTAIEQLVLES